MPIMYQKVKINWSVCTGHLTFVVDFSNRIKATKVVLISYSFQIVE